MPADIINLRRARKDKARAGRERQAADNRLAFGRTKAEKRIATSERELAERRIEGHRREKDES